MTHRIHITAIFLALLLIAAPARAIDVLVTTDKQLYAPSELIQINVTAVNPDDQDVLLRFNSSAQATYILDDTWDWSHHRAFLTVLTSRTIPAHGEFTWTFTHDPKEYFLGTGQHQIEGLLVNQKLEGGFEIIEVSGPAAFAVIPEPGALTMLLPALILLFRIRRLALP